ncbi:hypothetical protein JJB98_29425 [Bradyrhizobium diazoefficiens]|nr:hypothetical protein [Bradyrhizobium diazoefficiens]QQO23725.1 hypothetical protein JJB98_29425 [Bradyrhizobium diazoefficiens]
MRHFFEDDTVSELPVLKTDLQGLTRHIPDIIGGANESMVHLSMNNEQ